MWRMVSSVATLVVVWSGAAGDVWSQETTLERRDVVRLARARGPEVLAARGHVAEVAAEGAGLAALFAENPELQGGGGARWAEGGPTPQIEVGLEQPLPLGGGRGARRAAVRAAVAVAEANAAEVAGAAIAEALLEWVIALDAQARAALALESERVAAELAQIAERRQAAGDVSIVDVRLAHAAVLRARAARGAALAEGRASAASLAVRLGLRAALAVRGDLTEAPDLPLADLLAAARRRPRLTALRAEVREAVARGRIGDAARWPRLTLGVRWERDDGDDVAVGTLGLGLPLFDHGAGERAVARARRRSAEGQLVATTRGLEAEIRALHGSYETHRDALGAASEAVVALVETEPPLVRAYDAGEVALGDVLVLRRELLEARAERLDRARDLALARVRLEAAAGAWR